MLAFLARRIGHALITMAIIASLVFLMFRLLPGDPTLIYLDPASLSPESIARLKADFGLDKPLTVQYIIYMKNLAQGSMGDSFYYRRPAMSVLMDLVPNTLVLALTVMVGSYLIGTVVGALTTWYRGSRFEQSVIAGALFFFAAPSFWLAMMAIMLFSHKLGWLPAGGLRSIGYMANSNWEKFFSLDFLRHLILPAGVAILSQLATPLLLMRNTMLEVKGEDYIELARAKGLSEGRVIVHAARNALLPLVTSLALFMGQAVGGMLLIEYVFSWPGLGREIVLATARYDYPLAQAAFLLIATMVILFNLFADLIYGLLDPRVVYE